MEFQTCDESSEWELYGPTLYVQQRWLKGIAHFHRHGRKNGTGRSVPIRASRAETLSKTNLGRKNNEKHVFDSSLEAVGSTPTSGAAVTTES